MLFGVESGRARPCHQVRTVLYLQSSVGQFNQRELAGVREVSRRERWSLVVHPIGAALAERYAGLVQRRPESIRTLLSHYRPDGVIVEGGTMSKSFRHDDFGSTPVVFMDRADVIGRFKPPCIRSNAQEIAKTAFRELNQCDWDDYAFIPWIRPFDWSVERGAAFADLVRKSGRRFHAFPKVPANVLPMEFSRRVRDFVKSLPRPVSIFAVNDIIGICVLEALRHSKRRLPDDASVVGVDNNRDTCESSSPTLTSVIIDFNAAGRKAAETLAALMRGESPSVQTFGVCGIARRASTRRYRRTDARVSEAVEYIRKHAEDGLKVVDVVGFMGVSRRLAELRFREVVGASILDMIHQARLSKAEELLANTDESVSEIAEVCGYASPSAFRADFQKKSGLSPRAWRQHRKAGES